MATMTLEEKKVALGELRDWITEVLAQDGEFTFEAMLKGVAIKLRAEAPAGTTTGAIQAIAAAMVRDIERMSTYSQKKLQRIARAPRAVAVSVVV
jgi:hypothetical protein